MKLLKEICRGILIGVANIIPGVSGGTLAVSMGVYDKIIYALTHIRKEFKQSLKILVPVGIGAVIGLIGLSFVIKWLFEYYPIQTNFLFIGLIIGGLPAIFRREKGPFPWDCISFDVCSGCTPASFRQQHGIGSDPDCRSPDDGENVFDRDYCGGYNGRTGSQRLDDTFDSGILSADSP